MKTLSKICLLSAISALMFSCSTITQELPNGETASNVPVNFAGSITTRVVNNSWEVGDEVGIFMFSNGETLSENSLINNAFNKKYTYESTNKFAAIDDDDIIYYPNIGTVDFVAYYPFSAVEDYNVLINTTNQQKQEKLDLLYSNNLTDIAATEEAQKLIFNHKMCKVIFNITAGEGMSPADLKDLSIAICNVKTSGKFSLATGNFTLEENQERVYAQTMVNENECTSTAILLPQECKNKPLRISLLSGKQYNSTFNTAHQDWESGKKYTYSIELTNNTTEGTLTGEINEWTDDTDENSDLTPGDEGFEITPWDGTITTSWYSSNATEMDIPSANALAGLAKLVNEGISFDGITLNLLNDVDMNNIVWAPIGISTSTPFNGTFNGGGHIIKNLNPGINENAIAGLFGVNNGEIQNTIVTGTFNIENTRIAILEVGGICGQNNGTIYNCRNYANIVAKTSFKTDAQNIIYLGGIAGINRIEKITDSENYGTLSAYNSNTHAKSYCMVGGISGSNQAAIENCENVQNIQAANGNVRIGGISGLNTTFDNSTGKISDCTNIGIITINAAHTAAWAGGIVGLNQNKTSITSSINQGNIYSLLTNGSEVYGGGITAGNNNSYIYNCTNEGDITVTGCNAEDTGTAASGGIVGNNTNAGEIHTSQNSGKATATAMPIYYAGGITGINNIADDNIAYTYNCCTNNGYPENWIGNATAIDDLITNTEHEDTVE